jgi:hypothetical protein
VGYRNDIYGYEDGKLLWGAALKNKVSNYIRYVGDRKLYSGFRPIEGLQNVSHKASLIALSSDANYSLSLGKLPEYHICYRRSVIFTQAHCFASTSMSLLPWPMRYTYVTPAANES